MTRAARTLLAGLAALALTAAAVTCAASAAPSASAAGVPALTDWPEFGLNPQRTDATDAATAITAADVGRLRRLTVTIPGTADNSAVYVHAALVHGARRNLAIVTTTYGITLAIDADSGRILWRFVPAGIRGWRGSAQITTASPIIDHSRTSVFATSPNGLAHRLSIAAGREAPGWPARITLAPKTEKLTASLNIADGELLASTGGYFGDAPPYVGHLAAISLASGRVARVFNTLCAGRTRIIDPATCSVSDSAILSRSGPVVEPGGHRVLIATGNGPYNGATQFGDSLIELTLPDLRLRQVYTPANQAQLNTSDTDLGSGSPALLPGGLAWIAGKDSLQRVVSLAAMDGRPAGSPARTGGERQTLPTPGNQQIFSAPAVWHSLLFVADTSGTGAYRVAGGRLHELWENSNQGTSPVVAGGLLYVYDPSGAGINVYRPRSGHRITVLPAPAGHWNSPIVVDGHVIEPTGNANDHDTTGTVVIYSVR